MAKANATTLREILSIVASRPGIANACRVVGISQKTFYLWLKKSRASDPKFLVDFPEGELPQQFCELLIQARRQSLIEFESTFRDLCMHGRERILRNASTGDIVWEKDPRFIGVPDEDMTLMGDDKPSIAWNRLLRDPVTGMPVAAKVIDPPSSHAMIKLLTSAVPGYADQTNVTLDAKVTGSVLVIGAPKNGAAPKQEPDAAETMRLNGLLEHAYEEPPEVLAEEPPAEHPSITELKRLKALSPEQRRAELSAKPMPQPDNSGARYITLDERAEGVGAGHVKPGGYKVR